MLYTCWFPVKASTKCFFLQVVPGMHSTQALHVFRLSNIPNSRSWWPRCLCGSEAARLLGLWAWIMWGAWMSLCCESSVLSGRSACDRLITCTEESYRVWYVWVWSWTLVNEALAHETLSKLISNWHSYKVEITFVYFGLLECDAV
jgi:hypothetical protein